MINIVIMLVRTAYRSVTDPFKLRRALAGTKSTAQMHAPLCDVSPGVEDVLSSDQPIRTIQHLLSV